MKYLILLMLSSVCLAGDGTFYIDTTTLPNNQIKVTVEQDDVVVSTCIDANTSTNELRKIARQLHKRLKNK